MHVQANSFAPAPSGAPLHALPRKFIEPILFLGDRLTHVGNRTMREAKAALNEIARSTGLADYAEQRWFRDLSDQKACEMLDIDTAKRGALVLLALLIKLDPESGDAHRTFFTRTRTRMNADPVTVPVSIDQHRRLVDSYLGA
jgi:hypothetical protein